MDRFGKLIDESCGGFRWRAGGEHGSGCVIEKIAGDRHDLFAGLPFGIDRLRHALAQFAMRVELRETEVRDGQFLERADGFVDRDRTVFHAREQVFQLFWAHGASVGCPIVPDLTFEQMTIALAVVAAVALICFLLVIRFAFKLRRVRREYMTLRGESDDRDIVSSVSHWVKQVKAIEERMDVLAASQEEIGAKTRLALQRFHMVRYDAFDDMGGRLSFSAALLDDHGDGVVITSINGRTETRTYAKPVQGLTSDHNLSEEEREAIAGAVAGYGRGESQPAAAR